jgi:uncharacterized integral membrane protein
MIMHKKGYYTGLVLLGFLVIFILQNIVLVNVNILFWSFYAPRSLILIMVFVAGGITGLIFGRYCRRKSE